MNITPRYKAGDRVMVRDDLTAWVEYNGIGVVPEMTRLKGKIVNIRSYQEFASEHCGTPIYRVEEVGGWNWTESMFVGKMDRPRFEVQAKEVLAGISDSVFEMLED